MMPEIDPVIVQLRADVAKYRADMEQTARRVNENFNSQARAVVRLEDQIKASSNQISSSMRSLTASLATGFSAKEVANMADSYTRFTNQLKVAGLEGMNLTAVQDRLFKVAQQNGVELEAIGTLYSRAAQNQKELGASSSDLIALTKAVAASLRVSGTSTQEASGSLLQLGQALGSPRVQAEEFNSLLDTMQPLLRGAAKYIDGTGDSLAGLTAKIKDQNGPGVSNVELFRAIIRAMEDLEKQADSTALTIGAAFTNLTNSLTRYIGEADKANGASAAITSALNTLAENLDTVAEALAVIAGVMGAKYVAAAAQAVIASGAVSTAIFAIEARAIGAATTMEALALTGRAAGGTLLAAFGGPIGAAVLALGAGIYALTKYTEGAAKETDEYRAKVEDAAKADETASNLSLKLASARGAERVAVEAAARAEIERTKRTIEAAKADVAAAKAALEKARSLQAAQNTAAASAGGTVPGGTAGIMRLTGERGVNQAQNELANQQKLLDGAEARLRTLESSLVIPSAGGTGGGNSDSAKALAKHQQKLADLEKLKVGASGKQLANINRQIDREKAIIGNLQKGVGESAAIAATSSSTASHARKRDRSEQELSRLAVEELQARLDLTTNAQDRADLQQDILAEERKQRVAEINQDEDLSAPQKAAALKRITKLYGPAPTDSGDIPVSPGLLQQAVTRQKEEQLAREALERAQAGARNDEDLLRAQADLAITRADRREIELKLLDLAYQQERAEQQAVLDSATASDAQREIAAERLRILDQLKGYDAERIGRQYESPLEQRRRQVRETAANMGDAIEDIEIDAVDELADGLARASTEYIKLGGIAGDVINSIISDLVRLAAKQAIFGALGGSGGGSGGVLGSIAGLLGFGGGKLSGVDYGSLASAANSVKIPGFAKGTNYAPGGLAFVGEEGPELVELPRGSRVIPNHQLAARAAASMSNVSAARPVNSTTVISAPRFDLKGAVITAELYADMQRISEVSAARAGAASYSKSMRDAPGAVRRAQRFRTT